MAVRGMGSRRRLRLQRGDRALELHHGRHHTDEFARLLLGAAGDEAVTDAGPHPLSLSQIGRAHV